jgi:hypothetical protein
MGRRPDRWRPTSEIMMDDLTSRVAVLEQIARTTEAILGDIRSDIREIRSMQDRDFRWLLGLYLAGTTAILGVLAHAQHWI